MILNSTRFTVPLVADKYLNGIQLIRQELQTHSRVEEHVFYPAVMRLRAEPARGQTPAPRSRAAP